MRHAVAPTAPQLCWEWLGYGPHDPPEPKSGPRYGPDPLCWLCGGETDGVGWWNPFPDTFTNHNLARSPGSRTVCQACVALSTKPAWERHVAAHPEMGLKTGRPILWRNYRHLFAPTGHECPNRARQREILLDPPEPPFVLTIAVSGQKHLLFRAEVARSRESFPVQMEDAQVWVPRDQMRDLLCVMEALMAAGCRREAVVSGEYRQDDIRRAGTALWLELEARMRAHRLRPDLVALAGHVAKGREKEGAERGSDLGV